MADARTMATRVATLVVVAAALAGCLSAEPTGSPGPASNAPLTSPSPTSSPSGTPLSSVAPSTQPPASVEPTNPDQLRTDAFAKVVSDGLRVRSEPFVGDASRKLEPLLWNGAALFVIDGPVAGSGYAWYLVEPMAEVDVQVYPDPPPPGWVAAASRDGEPWLAPLAEDCYDTPLGWLAFDLMSAPIGLSALSCFGGRALQFTAGVSIVRGGGCRDVTGPWSISPAWFGPCPDPAYRLADPESELTDDAHALDVTIAPGVDVQSLPTLEPNQWLLVDVVGQYAHPAASSCRATPTGGDGEGPPRPEVVVLRCRAQFVVTSMTVHVDT